MVGKLVHPLPAHRDSPFGGPVQSANQIKQGALAGPGRSHQGEKFAGGNIQAQIRQDMNVFGASMEDFFDSVHLHQGTVA